MPISSIWDRGKTRKLKPSSLSEHFTHNWISTSNVLLLIEGRVQVKPFVHSGNFVSPNFVWLVDLELEAKIVSGLTLLLQNTLSQLILRHIREVIVLEWKYHNFAFCECACHTVTGGGWRWFRRRSGGSRSASWWKGGLVTVILCDLIESSTMFLGEIFGRCCLCWRIHSHWHDRAGGFGCRCVHHLDVLTWFYLDLGWWMMLGRYQNNAGKGLLQLKRMWEFGE